MADFKGFKVDGKEYPWGDYVTVGRAENSMSGEHSTAEGSETVSSGTDAHAEGAGTKAKGDQSHAEGADTAATGWATHAEGSYTIAYGSGAHAEGNGEDNSVSWCSLTNYNGISNSYTVTPSTQADNITVGMFVVATIDGETRVGYIFQKDGNVISVTPGVGSNLNSKYVQVRMGAVGSAAHVEGKGTLAIGNNSHAEGTGTIAQNRSQHVFGEYNIADSVSVNRGTYVEIVGKGQNIANRSNARTLDWDGNEVLAGSLTLGKGTADEVTITAAQLKALLNLIAN